jgi:hypothetical protein
MPEKTYDVDPDTGEVLSEAIGAPPEEADSGNRLSMSKMGLEPVVVASEVAKLHPPYDRVHLATYFGILDRIKLIVDDRTNPPQRWKALYGKFGAINELTGEELRSSTCFLPGEFHQDALEVATEEGMFDPDEFPELLERAKAEQRNRWDTKSIDFKIAFFAVKSKAAPLGYTWIGRWVSPVRKADPLRALRAEARAYAPGPRALPNPRKEKLIEHERNGE